MSISLIAAMDRNGVIGKDNKLPWSLPNDLRYFKRVTEGNIVVMGRKCYESIGHALPGRTNIVLTTDPNYYARDCYIYHSIEDFMSDYKLHSEKDDEVFIIGGSEIYKQFLPHADKLYITKIDHEFEGDTFFPEIDPDTWIEIGSVTGRRDEYNLYPHSFHVYLKEDFFVSALRS